MNGTLHLEAELQTHFSPMTISNNLTDGEDLHWRPAIDFFLQFRTHLLFLYSSSSYWILTCFSCLFCFSSFGTHILTNYTTGDALYQVLVYNASSIINHVEFKDRLEKFKPSNASRAEWISLFSEPHPLHHGKLQVVVALRATYYYSLI